MSGVPFILLFIWDITCTFMTKIDMVHTKCISNFNCIKGTTSPAERCDLGGVKLEKVHEFFQVCLNFCQRNCDNMWLVMARYEIKVSHLSSCHKITSLSR